MKPKQLNGMLLINKGRGTISKDVSREIARRCGKLKMGHVGTLDPNASGVLPLVFGGATKLQDYLLSLPKTYEFDLQFGVETDTLDSDGVEVDRCDARCFSQEQLESTLAQFRGLIRQVPPIFSAIKYKGKPLYKYAREGRADEVPLSELAREVEVFDLSIVERVAEDVWKLRVTCSKGTYVRVLARDIAVSLGSLGNVIAIHRESAAGSSCGDAIQLDEIKDISDLEARLLPLEDIAKSFLVWRSEVSGWTKRLRSGQKLLVQQRHFAKSLVGNPSLISREREKPPIFLLDEDGAAFGLGELKQVPDGCIEITMKRGLIDV